MRHLLHHTLAALLLVIGLDAAARAVAQAAPVDLRILAINDFHGHLRPPGGIRIADPDDKTKKITIAAGGAESMATLVKQLRAGTKNTIFVAAGDLIKDMLEQQWLDPKRTRILQVSKGFNYAWDATKPYGEHVIAESMSLNGARIDPDSSYRVTVNNYLSVGGDGFSVLTKGTAQRFSVYDADALYAYFGANSPIAPASADRITRMK